MKSYQGIMVTIVSFLMSFSVYAANHSQIVTVGMYDKYFSPSTVTIHPGQTVVWVNRGQLDHDVTSTKGIFKSGEVAPGGTMRYTFNKPGVYPYKCTLHTFMFVGMIGKVIVK